MVDWDWVLAMSSLAVLEYYWLSFFSVRTFLGEPNLTFSFKLFSLFSLFSTISSMFGLF